VYGVFPFLTILLVEDHLIIVIIMLILIIILILILIIMLRPSSVPELGT